MDNPLSKIISEKINTHLKSVVPGSTKNGCVLCVSGGSGIGKYTTIKEFASSKRQLVELIEINPVECPEDLRYLVWCQLRVKRMYYSSSAPVKVFLIKNIEDCKTVGKLDNTLVNKLLSVFHSGDLLPNRCHLGPISGHILVFTCRDIYSDQCKVFRSNCSLVVQANKPTLRKAKEIFSKYDPKRVQEQYELSKGNLRQMAVSLEFSGSLKITSGSDSCFSTDYNTASYFLGNYRETATMGKPYHKLDTRDQFELLHSHTSPLVAQLVRENLQNGIKFKQMSQEEAMCSLSNAFEAFSDYDFVSSGNRQFQDYDDKLLESLAIISACRCDSVRISPSVNLVLKYPPFVKRTGSIESEIVSCLESNRENSGEQDYHTAGRRYTNFPNGQRKSGTNDKTRVISPFDVYVFRINPVVRDHAWVICERYIHKLCAKSVTQKLSLEKKTELVEIYCGALSCLGSYFVLSPVSDKNLFGIFDLLLKFAFVGPTYRKLSPLLKNVLGAVYELQSNYESFNSKICDAFEKIDSKRDSQNSRLPPHPPPLFPDSYNHPNPSSVSHPLMKGASDESRVSTGSIIASLRSTFFETPLEYILWLNWVNSQKFSDILTINQASLGKRNQVIGSSQEPAHKRSKNT